MNCHHCCWQSVSTDGRLHRLDALPPARLPDTIRQGRLGASFLSRGLRWNYDQCSCVPCQGIDRYRRRARQTHSVVRWLGVYPTRHGRRGLDTAKPYLCLRVTLIEIRPHRWGWKVFEAPDVKPLFPEKNQAINYAQSRACFRSGEIRVLDSRGKLERTIAFNEADRKL
jgi:hypothetical protein